MVQIFSDNKKGIFKKLIIKWEPHL
jgi:hypothetical protein